MDEDPNYVKQIFYISCFSYGVGLFCLMLCFLINMNKERYVFFPNNWYRVLV